MDALLLKAIAGKKESNHSHIIYIKPDGTGITSKNNGHIHRIQPSGDILSEKVSFIMEEVNNHLHEISDIEIKDIKEEEFDDEKEVRTAWKLYKKAIELEKTSRESGDESEDFKQGKQWNQEDIAILKDQNRTILTINEIKPKLDVLSGYQRQNRMDIKTLPMEGGDETTSNILNLNIKNICQQNNFDYEETSTFDDVICVGRSAMSVNVVANNFGDIDVKIDNNRWRNVFFGEHTKLDGADMEYAGKYEKFSKAKLKELYPDKADDIEKDYELIIEERRQSEIPRSRSNRYVGKGKEIIDLDPITTLDSELVDIAKKDYRLIEVQRKEYIRTPVAFNAKHNFYMSLKGVSDKDVENIKKLEDINIINHVDYYTKVTVFAGNVLLRKEKSLFKGINIVPFYCNKLENKWWGKVEEVKDPQRELNKRHSQAIDIINKMASYGIGVTESAFEGPKDYYDFKSKRNTPGFIQKFKDGYKEHLHEFQGVKYPSEVVEASNLSSEKISTIMNIHPEMLGSGSPTESGIATTKKIMQGMIGNEFLYDNFRLSKRRVAKLIIEAIQIAYSPEKLLRVAENQNNNTFYESESIELYPKISDQEKLQFALQSNKITSQDAQVIMQSEQQGIQMPTEIRQILDSMQLLSNQIRRNELIKLLSNLEITKYDLVVTESPYSPSTMYSNYMILSELFKGNPNAPYAELIKLIPFLDKKIKDGILGQLQSQAQASAQEQKQKYDMEIQKTLIASQSRQQQGQTT